MINSQRSTAIKFEINHDIMWRAYYRMRLGKNAAKIKKVYANDAQPLKALIDNDRERIRFYTNAAKENYNALKELLKKQDDVNNRLADLIQHSVEKIEN